jgi:signal transduction histidine kinase
MYNLDFIFTLVTSFLILFIGILALAHDRRSATNYLFFSISLVTVFWAIANYFSINVEPASMIYWARLVIFFGVAHAVLFFLFIFNFPNRNIVAPKWFLFLLATITVGVMALTQTSLIFEELVFNGVSFSPKAGPFIPLLGMIVVTSLLASLYILIKKYIQAKDQERRSWGMMLFGFSTSYTLVIITNFILVNYYNNTSFIPLAPAFMLPFIIGMAYSILKFRLMNIKTIATETMVFVILSISLVQIFVSKSTSEMLFNIVSFCLFLIFSGLLIRSVVEEIERKEELQRLNIDLENLVQQRESLMHLITHKVKGSFTHSKYIFAGILDGTFGDANAEIKKRAEQGLEANDGGIKTVDLVLNTANLQKGIVKYEMKKIDFKDLVAKTIGEKKVEIEKKGLHFESNIKSGTYQTLGDAFWLKEAVSNLIENSIKYTKEGTINVTLSEEGGKILLSVKDTGVGITEEDKKNLFKEGGRGKDSIKINVDSTGYGLYSVKLIVEAHSGTVWAESEGLNKGSTFSIKLNKTE